MNAEVKKNHVYFNSTDGPYTMDTNGRILGGLEESDYPETRQTKIGVQAGLLLDKGEVQETEPVKVEPVENPNTGDSDQEDKQQRTTRSSKNQEK